MATVKTLGRIDDVQLICELCSTSTTVGEAMSAINDEGEFGCPVPDCGGIAKEHMHIRRQPEIGD